MGALERRLGVQLLHRSTRVVALTDAGRQYYQRMKPLLEELTQADGELASRTQQLSGLVRVAASSTFGRLHVVPLLPRLLALHPQLQLDLKLTDGVQDLLAEGIDLAIRISPDRSPDAVVKRVTGTRLVFNGMDHWPFESARGRYTVRVNGNLSSNTVETILAAVQAGVGIGMFHRASLTGDPAAADVVTVLDDHIAERRDVSLIWPHRKFIPARVRQVTEFFALGWKERLGGWGQGWVVSVGSGLACAKR